MAFLAGFLKSLPRSLTHNTFLNGKNGLCYVTVTTYTKSSYPDAPPPAFRDIEMPEVRELPEMQRVPQYYINLKPPLLRKSHRQDLRGPERIHNRLLHKQYGIIALSAGNIKYQHADIIVNTINKEMDKKRTFAVWRIDPLWKPMTKKGIGKRMGGGKPNVHHYATPVRAGRIVIEVGGRIEYEEVYPMLLRVAIKMPFDAMPVNQEMLEKLEKEADELHRKNINPFNFGYTAMNDMQGCNMWNSPWDYVHNGDYI